MAGKINGIQISIIIDINMCFCCYQIKRVVGDKREIISFFAEEVVGKHSNYYKVIV